MRHTSIGVYVARTGWDQEDESYLASYDVTPYGRPSVAVDVVLLTVGGGALRTLLVRRTRPPQAGRWAIPGGFVGMEESLDAAAHRILATKAGLEGVFVEQLYTFGAPDRDPRTRVISVVHYALVEPGRLERAGRAHRDTDIRLAGLIVPEGPEGLGAIEAKDDDGSALALAFDHARMLRLAVDRIRGKLDYAPIGFELLKDSFSLRDLRLVHEAILGRLLNKDSFRRKMLDRGLVETTGECATGLGHRPPELYRFSRAPGGGSR
jgi:8-oxo-dGTP diphosphatase